MTTNSTTAEDLAEFGIHRPDASTPFGAYAPAVQTGNLLFMSGMVATSGHTATMVGVVGKDLDVSPQTYHFHHRLAWRGPRRVQIALDDRGIDSPLQLILKQARAVKSRIGQQQTMADSHSFRLCAGASASRRSTRWRRPDAAHGKQFVRRPTSKQNCCGVARMQIESRPTFRWPHFAVWTGVKRVATSG